VDKRAVLIISTALDVIEEIFAVLYVSHMGLTNCYKTVVFEHLNCNTASNKIDKTSRKIYNTIKIGDRGSWFSKSIVQDSRINLQKSL